MPFNLKDTNPAERFYYPSYAEAMAMPKEKREWVEMRLCVGNPLKEIEAQTDTKRVEHVQPMKKNGKINRRASLQRIEYVDRDEKLYNELTFDHMISAWHLIDQDGNEIECSVENKMLMLGIIEFDRFIGECLETMIDDDHKKAEDQESNLSSIASESQTSQLAEPAAKPSQSTEKNPTAKTA